MGTAVHTVVTIIAAGRDPQVSMNHLNAPVSLIRDPNDFYTVTFHGQAAS